MTVLTYRDRFEKMFAELRATPTVKVRTAVIAPPRPADIGEWRAVHRYLFAIDVVDPERASIACPACDRRFLPVLPPCSGTYLL